ncbi:tyrosine-type recombinase/integrase [Streptomyces lavenduligriseus]|uniref:Tyrosine-type recombinase/integrase n=1 Tax=Streptomyces lavenduligriseus TaxID=67315 RepID=A0ABT0P4V8_9ACTN|nr:tyrosine-type recombinase/integrase [Streptomyces lavenduligriseus]MCL3998778.1 tyrosine-type recombinase/integrase [Streptomyces lavenduligriseus]
MTGVVRWVVVDAGSFDLQTEAVAFLASLRARGCSPNTERAYAGRVALYLNYCRMRRLDWRTPGFLDLADVQRWLVETPLPPRAGQVRPGPVRYRSRGTANAIMTVVGEFLRFAAVHGWVPASTAGLLSQPKLLRFTPPGYDTGESGQRLQAEAAVFRFKVTEPGYEDLSGEQIRGMIAAAPSARDRFLIALLACTGLRIGEALGLHRDDMHLLASSRAVGCGVEGPHVHVRRRTDNPNRVLAKSRRHRFVPVTADLVALYTDYQYERDDVAEAGESEMVFVNLFRPPLGRAMSYPNAKEMFDRLGRAVGHACRPHMLRHSAATRWLRDGVDRDVVQRLLGHASPLSMEQYRHVDDAEARAAVERVGLLTERR